MSLQVLSEEKRYNLRRESVKGDGTARPGSLRTPAAWASLTECGQRARTSPLHFAFQAVGQRCREESDRSPLETRRHSDQARSQRNLSCGTLAKSTQTQASAFPNHSVTLTMAEQCLKSRTRSRHGTWELSLKLVIPVSEGRHLESYQVLAYFLVTIQDKTTIFSSEDKLQSFFSLQFSIMLRTLRIVPKNGR